MISIKIPTKITILGEHAIVYGVPAIASTIPVYIYISGRIINNEIISITLNRGISTSLANISIHRSKEEIHLHTQPENIKKTLSYILTAINVCENEFNFSKNKGYELVIESPLPVGVGLGTSAAISVGTITLCLALNNYITKNLDDERAHIAKMAWTVEKIVQSVASPMDTHTIALGGLRYIEPQIPLAHPLDINYHLPLIIGYTNRRSTTAELVHKVRKLGDRHKELFNEILNTVRHIVKDARKALLNSDLETLGELMNINHGILQSLGIVDLAHDTILHALRNAGAIGAKTSGAGGGGAFIALARSNTDVDKLTTVAESLGAKIVATSLCKEGVTLN